jgi:hypothetical protein
MFRTVIALLAVLASGPALAQGADPEPEVPRDPSPVRDAQDWLNADWRDCRATTYPADALAEKVSTTVRFERAGKARLRGVVTIGFHLLDGTPLAANRAQSALARCVKRRFEARSFHAASDQELAGRSWGLANPAHEAAVLEAGELGREAATEHARHELGKARARCGVARGAGRLGAAIDVDAGGRVTGLRLEGAPPADARCLQARLLKALRFPASAKGGRVAAAE